MITRIGRSVSVDSVIDTFDNRIENGSKSNDFRIFVTWFVPNFVGFHVGLLFLEQTNKFITFEFVDGYRIAICPLFIEYYFENFSSFIASRDLQRAEIRSSSVIDPLRRDSILTIIVSNYVNMSFTEKAKLFTLSSLRRSFAFWIRVSLFGLTSATINHQRDGP